LTIEGCHLCPGGLKLEFIGEFLAFSIDSTTVLYQNREEITVGNLKSVIPVRFRCGAVYKTILLTPKSELMIEFASPEKGFMILKSDDLNQKIQNFAMSLDSLFENSTVRMLSSQAIHLLDKLIIEKKLSIPGDTFLNQFIEYSKAQLLLVTDGKSKTVLYQSYLAQKPIQWRNEAYAQFFRDFYEDFLLEMQPRKSFSIVLDWIKTGGSWRAVDSALQTLPLMDDSLKRHVAFCLGLMKISGQKDFKTAPLFEYPKLLSQVYRNTPEASQFFQTCTKRLSFKNYGSFESLARMRLRDASDKIFTPIDIAVGKAFLIYFFDPFSKPDVENLSLISGFEKSFKGKLKVVPVLITANPEKFGSQIDLHKWKIPVYVAMDPALIREVARGRPAFVCLFSESSSFISDELSLFRGSLEDDVRRLLKW